MSQKIALKQTNLSNRNQYVCRFWKYLQAKLLFKESSCAISKLSFKEKENSHPKILVWLSELKTVV